MESSSKPLESSPKRISYKYDKDKPGEHRLFTRWQKELCWKKVKSLQFWKSSQIFGRDPDRWRYDPLGNPVLNALRGCPGPACHEYDHIIPFSKGTYLHFWIQMKEFQGDNIFEI